MICRNDYFAADKRRPIEWNMVLFHSSSPDLALDQNQRQKIDASAASSLMQIEVSPSHPSMNRR